MSPFLIDGAGITLARTVIQEAAVSTVLTSKGQVTIPKQIREALHLAPGCVVDFSVNGEGDVVIHKPGTAQAAGPDRFEAARGRADIKWRTDDLMALLRGED